MSREPKFEDNAPPGSTKHRANWGSNWISSNATFESRCCIDDGCRCYRGSCYGPNGNDKTECPGYCDGTGNYCGAS